MFKVSANPKLTVLHNFGFLCDWINIRNSFRLKKIHKKCYLYGKLLNKNNSAILIILISCWQLSAKHVFVFHKTHAIRNLGSSQSCCLVKSMNVFEKETKIVSLFFVKVKTKEREESIWLWSGRRPHFEPQRFFLQPRWMSKNMNRNWIRVKRSRISPASLLTWTEFREKDVSFIV